MKVLVTGGAGFIGSHIVDKLIKMNYEVVVVDNLSTGNKNNLNSNALFYRMDITDNKLNDIFLNEKPQYVIHLAAQVSVPYSLKNPLLDCRSNIIGTLNLLECCKNNNVEKLIYSSSAAVYGEPQYLPVDELHPVFPQSNYGISKHAAEMYIKGYSGIYGLNYIILRYSNVYGPRQESKSEGGVIAIFTENILGNKPLVILGSGEQTRDFIFVNDVADANIAALTTAENQIINISTNTSTSINSLIKVCENILGNKINPNYSEGLPGDIFTSVLDNTKAKQLLGWYPKHSLVDGLKETL